MPNEMNSEKIVIFDLNIPELMDNNLFIPKKVIKISHTILPFCYLRDEALKIGIKFITPDIYLAMDKKPQVVLISHLKTEFSDELFKKFRNKIKLSILICQESPFVATRFYVNLSSISRLFKFSFVFSGMEKRLSKETVYQQMFFPQPYSLKDFNPKEFNKKKLITMIAGAKLVGNWKKNLLIKFIYGLKVKEIYKERFKAVKYFIRKDGEFDLYGRGWNNTKIQHLDGQFLDKVYKGEVKDKFSILKNYKFTLCFENAIFPGYVTEKIFDAIFAGSVPIYYGAPDIKKYVPAEAFIDVRGFNNYDELYLFINSINEAKYGEYLEAMKNFISSDDYKKFSQEHFAKKILNILETEFIK